jgi:large subunit ribosomal protein L25
LTLSADELAAVVRHGNHFVELTGGIKEKAFIKEVQWNTWGTEILHVDFARVSEHEKVHVVVPVELRGEAPGVKDGGAVKHVLHQIELECEAASVPDKLEVNINHLEFGALVHVSDLVLPQGSTTALDPAILVVSCVAPVEVAETEETATGEEEPEVIGRKKTDDEEEEK